MTTRRDRLEVQFTAEGDGQVRSALTGTAADIAKVDKAAGGAASGGMAALRVAGAGLAGVFAGIGFAEVLTSIVKTTAEMQRFNAMLVTVTGSSEGADKAMAWLRDFAKQTPFQLSEVVTAFTKLQARGIEPTSASLTGLGNTAAAMGKSLDQAVEALADAVTGEFERLKEFGIKASAQGEQVAFTFKGVTTQVGNNADEITGYLDKIGNHDFAGGMARQSATLEGQWSNLKDAADELANTVGSTLAPAFTALLGVMNDTAKGAANMWKFMFAGDDAENTFQQIKTLEKDIGRFETKLAGMKGQKSGGLIGLILGATPEQTAQHRAEITEFEAAIQRMRDARDRLANGPAELEAQNAMLARRRQAIADNTVATKEWTDAELDMLAAVREQVDLHGKQRSAVLENERAKKLALATTEESRAEIGREYDALIALVKADERAAAAKKSGTAATAASTKAKREAAQAAAAYAKVIELEADIIEQGRKAMEAQRLEADQYIDSLIDLEASINPVTRAWRDFTKAMLELSIARERDGLSDEDFDRWTRLFEGLRDTAIDGDALNKLRDAGNVQVDAYTEVWMQGVESLADTLTDQLVNGFEDAGEALKAVAKQIIGDLIRTFLQQQFVIPLQARLIGGAQGQGFGASQISQLLGLGGQGGTGLGGAGAAGGAGGLGGIGAAGSLLSRLGPLAAFALPVIGARVGGVGGGALGGALGGFAFASTAMGAGLLGGTALAGATAAATGAALGSVVPILGTIIGAVLGAALGRLFGSSPRPQISVGAAGGRFEASGSSQFGTFGATTRDIDLPAREVIEAITDIDNAIAGLLDPEEIARVREAMRGFTAASSGSGLSVEAILSARVNAIIQATEPQWSAYLGRITDLEDRIKAFEGLRNLQNQLDAMDAAGEQLAANALEKLRTALQGLDKSVTDTAAALEAAIASNDPAAIATAAEAAKQAVIRRFEAEIRIVEELEAKLISLEQSQRAFDLAMAQRIAGVSGGAQGGVLAVLERNLASTRSAVGSARTPEQSLAYLNEFISTVDAWLQSTRAEVQRWLAERLAALDAERNGILGLAQERANSAAALAASQQQAQAAAAAAVQEALQAQLELAQQWVSVLDRARQLQEQMTFGSGNPLGAQARYALLGTEINAVQGQLAGATGSQQAQLAQRLLELLQQQGGMAQELFQRPGENYLEAYNEIMRRIAGVRAIAEPEADRAEQLQEQIAAAGENTYGAVVAQTDLLAYLSQEERDRLEAIAEEEEAARAEAEERLAAADAQAREYYEWAQAEGRDIQNEQRDLLQSQLDLITGGTPVDQFIAARAAASEGLLREIRDDIRNFLAGVTGGGTAPGTTPVNPGAGGTSPGNPPGVPPVDPGANSINITINAPDPGAVGAMVVDAIRRHAPQVATIVGRERATA